MSTSTQSAVPSAVLLDDAEPAPIERRAGTRNRWPYRWLRRLWTIAIGAILCMTHVTSVAVVGWLMRWTRIRALHRWWRWSERAKMESFEDFRDSMSLVAHPHWLTVERRRQFLDERSVLGYAQVPWRSLWTNFRTGAFALLCIWSVTGWGCLITFFSWRYGWDNSFNKGYEQALVGPLSGLIGSLVLILALLYVPMARAHCAVSGRFREFYNFKLIWRLIHARFTAYVLFTFWFVLLSLPVQIAMVAPAFFGDHVPFWSNASDEQVANFLQQYYLACSVGLFLIIWLIAGLSARLYAKSMLTALQRGKLKSEDLTPEIRTWLGRLDLLPTEHARQGGALRALAQSGGWAYRRLLWIPLLVIWFGFIAKTYVGEFFFRHETTGFLNHPVVQLPCINHVPASVDDDD